jgi:uncharacterized repeat protein (TIGR03917 family)
VSCAPRVEGGTGQPPSSSPQRPEDRPCPPEVTTFVGRIDGAEITVGVQPVGAGPSPVLLRVHSPLLELLTAAYLAPDEAHDLAAALSSAAVAAAGCSGATVTGTPVRAAGAAGPPSRGDDALAEAAAVGAATADGQIVVTAGEGTTAPGLAATLDLVPAGSVLVDFAADTTVTLVFGPVCLLPAGCYAEPAGKAWTAV